MEKKQYSYFAYDANLVLKVPLHLWLIILWTVHHGLFILLGAFSSGDILKSALEYGGHVPLLASDLPGFLILMARMNRLPQAGKRTRWVWSNGRIILGAGLGMQLGAILTIHGVAVIAEGGFVSLAFAITSLSLLVLLKSQHIGDTFADFPSPDLANPEKK